MDTETLEKVGESYYKSTSDKVRDKTKTYYIITGWNEKRKATKCRAKDFKDNGAFRSMHDNYWYYVWNFCNTKKQGEKYNIEGVTEVDKTDYGYIYKERLTGEDAENAKKQIAEDMADYDPNFEPMTSADLTPDTTVTVKGSDPVLAKALAAVKKRSTVKGKRPLLASSMSESAISVASTVASAYSVDTSSAASFGQAAMDAASELAADLANEEDEAEEEEDEEEEEEKKKAKSKKCSKSCSKGGGGGCGGGKSCKQDGLCGGGNCCTGDGIQHCVVSPECEAITIAKAAITVAQTMCTQNLYTEMINVVPLISPIPDTTVPGEIVSSILSKYSGTFSSICSSFGF